MNKEDISDISSLTREQFESLTIDEYERFNWEIRADTEAHTLFQEKLYELFPDATQFVAKMNEVLRRDHEREEVIVLVVDNFMKFRPVVKIYVWTELMKGGSDDLSFAKEVHKYLALPILDLYAYSRRVK